MSGKYVSQKPTRGYNDPAPEVVRGYRVTEEAFAKAGACRNLEPQSMANYGKVNYMSDVPTSLTKQLDRK
jgi:hypothetical protein